MCDLFLCVHWLQRELVQRGITISFRNLSLVVVRKAVSVKSAWSLVLMLNDVD